MNETLPIDPQLSSYFGRAPRDLTRLTRVTLVLLTAWGVLGVSEFALVVRYWFLLRDPEATDAEWSRFTELDELAAFVDFLILDITYLVFGRWLYLAHVNVRSFGARGLDSTPLMAVLWYLVPLVQLVKPYFMMRQLSSASRNPGAWQEQPCHRVLPWWWGTWVGGIAVAMLIGLFEMEMTSVEDYEVWAGLALLLSGLQVGLSMSAAVLVTQIARDQQRVLEAA